MELLVFWLECVRANVWIVFLSFLAENDRNSFDQGIIFDKKERKCENYADDLNIN